MNDLVKLINRLEGKLNEAGHSVTSEFFSKNRRVIENANSSRLEVSESLDRLSGCIQILQYIDVTAEAEILIGSIVDAAIVQRQKIRG